METVTPILSFSVATKTIHSLDMGTAHVLFHCRFATPGNLEESRHVAKATRLRLSQTKRLLSFLSTKEELLATCNVRTKHTATARSVQRPTGSHLALSGKPSASLSTPKQGHSMGCRLDGINVIHVQPVPPGGRNDACSCLSAWCRHHGLLLHLCRLLPLLFSHFLPRLTSPSARATVVSTSRPADTTHTHTEPAKQSAHEQDLRPSLRIPLLKLLKLWPHKGLSTTCLVRMRHLLVGDVLPRFHGQPSLLEMLDPTKSSSDNWTPQPSGTVAWSVTHCCTHLQRTRPCRSKAPPRQRKRVDALLDSTHGVQTAPPNFQTRQEKSEPFARLTCSPRSRVSSHWRATKPLSDRHSSCQL